MDSLFLVEQKIKHSNKKHKAAIESHIQLHLSHDIL